MKKTLAIILALTMVICMFAGCAAKTQTAPAENPTPSTEVEQKVAGQPAAEQPATEEEAEKTYTFGISMPQLDNDGFKANLVGIQQFAEKNNITLEVTDGKNTVDTQMQNIEDLIIKGVDAIVMCPVDSGALAAAVKKAVDAGIPVVSFDRNVSGDVLTGLAESDNVAHGSAAADLMAEVAEKSGIDVGNLVVLELLGTQSATAGLERHQGFSSSPFRQSSRMITRTMRFSTLSRRTRTSIRFLFPAITHATAARNLHSPSSENYSRSAKRGIS